MVVFAKQVTALLLVAGVSAASPIKLDHASNTGAVPSELELAGVANKCQSIKPIAERLLVAARHKEDISWLVEQVEMPFLVYQTENSSASETPVRTHGNGAQEATAYLQFVAEYYDCLPEVTAFIHAHRSSWHSTDMVQSARQLNWSSVTGYLPLHEHFFQPYGMYFWLDIAEPQKVLKTVLATGNEAINGTFKSGQVINGTAYKEDETYHYHQALEVLAAWQSFFKPAGLGSLPSEIQYYCCAQFLVTRERIQRLPRDFYLRALHWSNHGITAGNFSPAYSRGLVFESLWHVIFGEPGVLPKAPSSELCLHYTCSR